MRDTFTRCLEAYAQDHPELVLVIGDLGFGVLFPFMEKYPKQFINAGISEQAMMSMAAGLAMEGKTVVVYSIGNFPTLRCIEQIRNCCAYHDANVKIVCVGAGFTYGALGMTHHATEDMSALRILPNVKVYAPADAAETEAVMGPFLSEKGCAYLRIGRGGETLNHPMGSLTDYRSGKALEQFSGTDAYILTSGNALPAAVEAAKQLRMQGYSIGVASFPTVKPLDEEYLAEISERVPVLYTLEEHTVVGGFGGAVCEYVSGLRSHRPRVVRMGIHDTYCAVVGNQTYLEKTFGLDADGVVKTVLEDLNVK